MKRLRPTSTKQKIVTAARLRQLAQRLHRQHKILVTTNGSFDLLHAGHLYLLEYAKSLGDVLVVGVNSDRSVKKYKSADRPIINEKNRVALLAGLAVVDYVHVFAEVNPIAFLNIVRPHIHVNSAQYGKNPIEAPTLKRWRTKLMLVPVRKALLSTTAILEKILSPSRRSAARRAGQRRTIHQKKTGGTRRATVLERTDCSDDLSDMFLGHRWIAGE